MSAIPPPASRPRIVYRLELVPCCGRPSITAGNCICNTSWMWKVVVGLLVVTSALAAPAKPPHGAKKIRIEYRWVSFSRDQASYTLEWNGGTYTVGKRTVDGKLVDGLYKALTDLRESD